MEYLGDDELGIYTDGSCYHGPRRGGLGVLFVTTDDTGAEQVIEEPQLGYAGASNNQMELQACVEALRLALGRHPPVDPDRYRNIRIFTDSMYVCENFDRAKYQWSTNGWIKSGGGPVLNAPLWKELVKLVRKADRLGKRVSIVWVRGHAKSRLNKQADGLARASAKGPTPRRLTHTRLRRKKSPRSVEPGSVQLKGQRLTIRIIGDEYLRLHQLNRYRYEVMSRGSPFYQNVDFICSDKSISLSRGHTYYVRVNEDDANPRITKVFREVQVTH